MNRPHFENWARRHWKNWLTSDEHEPQLAPLYHAFAELFERPRPGRVAHVEKLHRGIGFTTVAQIGAAFAIAEHKLATVYVSRHHDLAVDACESVRMHLLGGPLAELYKLELSIARSRLVSSNGATLIALGNLETVRQLDHTRPDLFIFDDHISEADRQSASRWNHSKRWFEALVNEYPLAQVVRIAPYA